MPGPEQVNLLEAIEEGSCSTVLNLLESAGIDLEQRDSNGQTPLIIASEKGNVEIVHELLKRNAEVNAQDEDGWTALIAACKEGCSEVAKELLESGARLQLADVGGWTPLVWASYKGHAEIVKDLLAFGADPNEKGQHGMTALIWASGRGHSECVKELLDAGASPDAADKYGTTALVWAARKGHLQVINNLVEKGASIDIAGTRGWTALIMAAKGGYTDVVDYLLQRDPNVNATDQEGYSALAWSAKHGHEQIVQKLIAKGAYYNLPDKEGETVLIAASRDGHAEVVRTLLSKFAEVDAVDSEGKTALFHAVEKGYTNIVRDLLEAGAKTEVINREFETPLIRATLKKHTECVALLLEKGAQVSAADRRGDTAVHIAVRGRYKRICELLLRNPKDARLLYRPNKAGETPYNIDRQHRNSILTQIFGTGLFATGKKHSEEAMGYDVYTSALADVLCEPSLSMPLTVGMYARWGSGKSFVLRRLQDEMREFAHQDLRPVFHFSRFIFIMVLVIATIIGVILWAAVGLVEGICVGLAIFSGCYCLFFCAYVTDRKSNNGDAPSCSIGSYVATSVTTLKLLSQLIFCIPPCPSAMKPALPVRFLFTDFSKLTCSGSEAASLVGMIETLCDVVEAEFGFFVTRLYRVFRAPSAEYEDIGYTEARWKRCCCCIPTFIIFLFIIVCGLMSASLFTVYDTSGGSIVTGLEISTASIVGVAVLVHLPTLCSILYSLVFSQKKRISVVATQLGLKEEGFIHALKQEVELLTDLVNCVDGFTRHQTRIVVVIDGLDNSEQSKVLQLLDSVNLLFTDPDAPFIILMALDPRVIIRAIDQSFSSILRESHISASDYLKSIVQLPFYLPEPKSNYTGVLPANITALLEDVRHNARDNEGNEDGRPASIVHDDLEWDGEMLHFDNEKSANMNRIHRDLHNCNGGVPGRIHPDMDLDASILYEPNEEELCLAHDHHQRELEMEERRKISADLAQVLADNETVNPLGVKRLMNIVSLTCRLLRARNIEYSWKRLAAWASLADGWPYKTSWLVLLIEDSNTHIRDNMSLKDLYEATLSAMPVINEVDCMVDGDPVYFETFLSSHQPLLTASDIRRFLLCTVHLDHSLRRQMVEFLQSAAIPNKSETESLGKRSSGYQINALLGVKDKQVNLVALTIDDVCKQLAELEGLDQKQISSYQGIVTENNINGKVLATCDLTELGQIMGMTFGDWQLFRAWILNARFPQECGTCHANGRCVSPGEMNCQLLKTSSAGWDQGVLGTPRRSMAMSEVTCEVGDAAGAVTVPTSPVSHGSPVTSQPTAEDEDAEKVPEIILQPPSAPDSEDDENCETTETELESHNEQDGKPVRVLQTYKRSKEEKIAEEEMEGRMDNASGKLKRKEETLIELEDDEGDSDLPPLPPPCYRDDEEDLPTPPSYNSLTRMKKRQSPDLMLFSEEERKNEEKRSDDDDLWIPKKRPDRQSTGSADFPPPPSPPTLEAMECTCEMLNESLPDQSGLFFEPTGLSNEERPSPIVLTMGRNGPQTNAVAVKKNDPKSSPPTSPRSITSTQSQTTSNSFSNHRTFLATSTPKDKTLNTSKSIPENMRPLSASDVGRAAINPPIKQKATSQGFVSPEGGSPPHNSGEHIDFPPPPPPLTHHSPTSQQNSPWVPLMQRFQLDKDSTVVEMDNPSAQRRPRPKTAPVDHKEQKFRTYTPSPKPTFVEVKKGDQKKDKKNETCV
ncbi:kinase D-interacting substrate of 220 kDa isoform X2 [Nematostella vectensis]|nr:kinase D-interacting substrate of 220 kDa isoform X2 [Nematostella vectensis]